MKKITITILTLLLTVSGSLFAQGKYGKDSADCLKYLSYYKEYYKQKAYEEAMPNWRKAYKLCPPTANQTMLIDGTALLRRLIAVNSNNPVYKDALVDSLITLHRVRAEAWPKNAVTSLNNMGLDLANYVQGDPARLYKEFNEIIAANKTRTKSSLFLFNLQAAIDLYSNGKLGAEEVINCYQNNLAYLDDMKPHSSSDAEQNQKVRTDLETLFISSKIASCDDLLRLFAPRFEANPEDINLVKNIVKMMSITENCQDNDLYIKAATNMYKLEPNYNSAYFLYKLNAARNNYDEAVKYMEEAIEYDDSDALTDAGYNYELAAFCYKNARFARACTAARAALDLDPSIAGKCYFLIGQVWGTVNCGGDEIQTRANFWVATDNLRKAAAADESLAEEANRLIAQYSRYYPQAAEAFMYSLTNGQAYTVNCSGMSATTTVRTQN
jgi:tetratricopeptide (TPR) repeat protein